MDTKVGNSRLVEILLMKYIIGSYMHFKCSSKDICRPVMLYSYSVCPG